MSTGGFIYAIGAEGMSCVKIGSTRISVEQRLKQLQTGQPQRLYIIAALPVDQALSALEKQIHRILEGHQQSGEWFDIHMDVATLKRLMGRAIRDLQQRYSLEPTSLALSHTPMEPVALQRRTFGERVAYVRTQHSLTREALADKAGVPLELLERIEDGLVSNPPLLEAMALSRALEKCMNYMTGVVAEQYRGNWWTRAD